MKLSINLILEAICILAISVTWCEFGYYYFVFYFNCSNWPGPESLQNLEFEELTKLMIIADTHIMGPIKSVKIDKLRREWQMKQAFSISNSIFKPDVIVFLGDLFDEASFSRDDSFHKAKIDFDNIFKFDREQQELIVIPGNHDVGFHNQMKSFPYMLQRFSHSYMSTEGIEISFTPKTERLNLILSNSMSFYNDTCMHCSRSKSELHEIEEYLRKRFEKDPQKYGAPIVLGHIPFYRNNDLNCSYPSRMQEKVLKENVQGEDVLHEAVSKTLLETLKPRISISGHTHMLCYTHHEISSNKSLDTTLEITITSYNHKYAEQKPGFLLMSANSTHVFTKHCNTIEEWVVVSVYIATLLTVLSRLIFTHYTKSEDEIKLNPNGEDKGQ